MPGRNERGPYASGLARREAILDAAIDLLAEVGYHGMSLRDVARRVGISHPGVIYHFPSKEILLMSVVSRYEEQIGFNVDELGSLEAPAVLDSILILLSCLGENPLLVEVECMLMVEASADVHPAHDHFQFRNQRLHTVLTQAWTSLVAEGKVRGGETPQVLAALQLSLCNGLMNEWLYNHNMDAVGGMIKFYLYMFTPEYAATRIEHFRESGWLR